MADCRLARAFSRFRTTPPLVFAKLRASEWRQAFLFAQRATGQRYSTKNSAVKQLCDAGGKYKNVCAGHAKEEENNGDRAETTN